ncbi:hypothetical protein [Microlunatus parietis]|uniref:Uncharacterized protein n=1 Tax=Microlunatus parietis TaxID=682979 RepID=A0A7Y9I797_9ACTN|nr:hypothetical protein [Microlunatus parietis]NYE71423.1 hypothetical protein [Microlunatus parietis]
MTSHPDWTTSEATALGSTAAGPERESGAPVQPSSESPVAFAATTTPGLRGIGLLRSTYVEEDHPAGVGVS